MSKITLLPGAPIGTQDRQCETGRGISGFSGVDLGPEHFGAGGGRKSTSAIALVALASLAPLIITNKKENIGEIRGRLQVTGIVLPFSLSSFLYYYVSMAPCIFTFCIYLD